LPEDGDALGADLCESVSLKSRWLSLEHLSLLVGERQLPVAGEGESSFSESPSGILLIVLLNDRNTLSSFL
jgi:hypothetical protein